MADSSGYRHHISNRLPQVETPFSPCGRSDGCSLEHSLKRHSRFLSTDSAIVASLAGMILLVALGGIKLSRGVAANMLRADAQSTSSPWPVPLVARDDEIPAVLDGEPPSAKTKK